MDDEHTAGFTQPCPQCSAVDWGISDEGRFFCRSCHNVIERTKEVVDPNFTLGSSRITTLSKGPGPKRPGGGRQWSVCEAFQLILLNQCHALLRLGVQTGFKDDLCHMWRRFLQTSRQAFTEEPARSGGSGLGRLDSDSEAGQTSPWGAGSVAAGSATDVSVCSGSADAAAYLTPRRKRRNQLMSMKKTLALIHLTLTWSREALTLSDLLRLVNEGHVPYVKAYEELPEEMKLEGADTLIFRVESVPSHQELHRTAQTLLLFLKLPAFPPISRQSLLHPSVLSLRYLTDANLPDQLHSWVCRLMERAGLADQALLTCGGAPRPVLPLYDLQAAALIIVTMKLIFGLDDRTEWDLSHQTGEDAGGVFNLRRWYRLLQGALVRGQQRMQRHAARTTWKPDTPLIPNQDQKCVTKKRRIAEQLQLCFHRLSSCPLGVQRDPPSSFRFCWGGEDGADGPSLHHKSLDGVMTLEQDVPIPRNRTYWHPALPVKARKSRSHFGAAEASLPRCFLWLLQLFCFLLDVTPPHLYKEVLRVERRVFRTRTKTRTRTRTRTKTSSQTGRETGATR